jgi:hypothetical protein
VSLRCARAHTHIYTHTLLDASSQCLCSPCEFVVLMYLLDGGARRHNLSELRGVQVRAYAI